MFKNAWVFYIFEFAGVTVSEKSTDRIFPWSHVCSVNILSVDFAYIFIRNGEQSSSKHSKPLMGYSFINFYWLLTFLCIYFFMYLVFVIYLQNSLCKPLQIPQIDYSHGASIILNLSSSKKQHVFGFYSLIEVLNCLHLCVYSFVYLIIFLFCLESFSLWMFFDVFPSLDFLYLLSISLSSLFLVYSLFYVFLPLFCIVSGFINVFAIYLLVVAFLCVYLFIYLMFILYLQNSFYKPLQISQIKYSDGASIILNLSNSKKENVFGSYSCIDWFLFSGFSWLHFSCVFNHVFVH